MFNNYLLAILGRCLNRLSLEQDMLIRSEFKTEL